MKPFCKIIVVLWNVLARYLPPELLQPTSETILRGEFSSNLTIFVSSLARMLVFFFSTRIEVLLLPSLLVVLIVGSSDEENLTALNSSQLLRLLERTPFCCLQLIRLQSIVVFLVLITSTT